VKRALVDARNLSWRKAAGGAITHSVLTKAVSGRCTDAVCKPELLGAAVFNSKITIGTLLGRDVSDTDATKLLRTFSGAPGCAEETGRGVRLAYVR